jgi:uncharacterized protein YciI
VAVFAAIYTYKDSTNEQRTALLSEHREWLAELKAESRVLEAGPTIGEPGALLVFEFVSSPEATTRLNEDPFFIHGLLESRLITEWQVKWGVIAAASSGVNAQNAEVSA